MAITHTPVHLRWSEAPIENIGNFMTRQFASGERLTIARIHVSRGGIARVHGHEPEEMLCVIKGALRVTMDGEVRIVRENELMRIPSGVEHELEALEDTLVLDAFSPVREDWI